MGEQTSQRGGRPKRFFSLTKAGARQLVAARRAFDRMWADVGRLADKAAR